MVSVPQSPRSAKEYSSFEKQWIAGEWKAGKGKGRLADRNPYTWSLYAKDGRQKYCYNFYGIDHFHVEAGEALPPGTHEVRVDFDYDGAGPAKGGTVRLFIDDRDVDRGLWSARSRCPSRATSRSRSGATAARR